MRRWLPGCVSFWLLGAPGPVSAQLPTELHDCVGPGQQFCNDSTAVLVDEGCGVAFYRYRGVISWAALRNVGPVTIAVQTRNKPLYHSYYPLYVEVRGRTNPGDGTHCTTGFGGHVVLVAQGGAQCGGTWESIGPIDLAPYGVPLGAAYSVQLKFFEDLPWPEFPGFEPHSIGFACIRVTSHPLAATPASWSNIKQGFR